MIIQDLYLKNFRNYENVHVSFQPHLNIITGQNAHGKTNLLESLVYLSLTRSHRLQNEKKLIRNDDTFARIRCSFLNKGKDNQLEAIIHQNGKTLIRDGIPVKKSSDFIGLLNVIIFSPDDLYIFNDHPQARRKMIDTEIAKVDPEYLLSLNKYRNILKEKNALLKNYEVDTRYLDILDEQLSDESCLIIRQRKAFVNVINQYLPDLYKQLSQTDIQANVSYRSFMEDMYIQKENVLEMIRRNREKDMEYHMSSVGIHREDITFELNGINVNQNASQGQKRMMILAYKMALIRYIEKASGNVPVLLLDDVLSELDSIRQKKLLNMIQNTEQCIITTTEIPEYMKDMNYAEIHIVNGKIDVQEEMI